MRRRAPVRMLDPRTKTLAPRRPCRSQHRQYTVRPMRVLEKERERMPPIQKQRHRIPSQCLDHLLRRSRVSRLHRQMVGHQLTANFTVSIRHSIPMPEPPARSTHAAGQNYHHNKCEYPALHRLVLAEIMFSQAHHPRQASAPVCQRAIATPSRPPTTPSQPSITHQHLTPPPNTYPHKPFAPSREPPHRPHPSRRRPHPRPGKLLTPEASGPKQSAIFPRHRCKKCWPGGPQRYPRNHWNATMNRALIPIQPSKRPLWRLAAGAFQDPSRGNRHATTPLSPETPAPPIPEPANDAPRE